MIGVTRQRSIVLSMLTALLVGGAAAACGSASPGGATGSPTASKTTVGFSGYNASTASAQSQIVQAIKDMQAAGWTVLTGADPAGNVAVANSNCVTYTGEHVDAIIVDVWAPSEMGQCVSAAAAAKIPVFYYGSTLGPGGAGATNTDESAPLNNLVMSKWSGNTSVKILALGLTPAGPCRDRYSDFIAKWTAAANPPEQVDFQDMNATIGTLIDGQTKTEQWLTANPPTTPATPLVIWACSGGAATGAVAAELAAHRSGIYIYGWDFLAQQAVYVQQGLVTATCIASTDGMATQILNMVKTYLKTKKSQGTVNAAYVIITPANYSQYASLVQG